MTKQLDNIIDKGLPGLLLFECWDLVIGYECLQFYYQDTLQCIQLLFGDLELVQHMVFVPEQHYTSHEQTCHIVNEMHTGDWWWSKQVCTTNFN